LDACSWREYEFCMYVHLNVCMCVECLQYIHTNVCIYGYNTCKIYSKRLYLDVYTCIDAWKQRGTLIQARRPFPARLCNWSCIFHTGTTDSTKHKNPYINERNTNMHIHTCKQGYAAGTIDGDHFKYKQANTCPYNHTSVYTYIHKREEPEGTTWT
jgi:hypothetical protein